jgi:GNAT superfamily N-acetyltransferase
VTGSGGLSVVQKLVRYLEMRTPEQLRPATPIEDLRVVRLSDPAGADASRVQALHEQIATPHLWRSVGRSDERWRQSLADPRDSHWIAIADGRDIGWGCLTAEDQGSVEILSFGIRPDAVGNGYGGAFLTSLVRCAWQLVADTGDQRVWLHTSSWDHPHALANYLARGFTLCRLELREEAADTDNSISRPVDAVPPMLVRPSVPIDAEAVSVLMADLGYELPVETVRQRLARLASTPDDLAAVAVEDATIVGMITAHVVPMFAEADPAFLRVTALSVAPAAKRSGVGQRLMGFAEYFAERRHCRLIEVSSGRREEREPAHKFYRALGYEDAATKSARYWKHIPHR